MEAVWLLLSMENDLPFKCYLIISHCFYDDNTIITCCYQEFFIITKATPLWHIELYFLSCKDDISFTWLNSKNIYWNLWKYYISIEFIHLCCTEHIWTDDIRYDLYLRELTCIIFVIEQKVQCSPNACHFDM